MNFSLLLPSSHIVPLIVGFEFIEGNSHRIIPDVPLHAIAFQETCAMASGGKCPGLKTTSLLIEVERAHVS
jgi:hypothetical protein